MKLSPRVRLSRGGPLAGALALALVPLVSAPPASAQTPAPPAEDGAFGEELARSKEDALKLYPDLANPQSALSKKYAFIEQQMHEDGNPVVTRANHPLVIARRAADDLGIRPVGDPVFKEVIPTFTTASGTTYKNVRVNKIFKDGISVTHESGAVTIPYLQLTDEQRERYGLKPNAPSPNLANSDLPTVIKAANDDCARDIASALKLANIRFDDLLKKAKFDFEREHLERQRDQEIEGAVAEVKDRYVTRLSRAGTLAREMGDLESLEILDHELRDASKRRFEEALVGIDERKAARRQRYEPLRQLLRGAKCEFLMDGRVRKREALAADGTFGLGSWTIMSADHIKIFPSETRSEYWCFKVDIARGAGTLVREASEGNFRGEVTFQIAK